jgi:hypothetical protein
MRAGEHVHALARNFESRAKEGASRAFAVRAGDMKDGRKGVLRPTEAVEKSADSLEPEPVSGGGEFRKAIELLLNGRIPGPRKVGHQAASFSGAR